MYDGRFAGHVDFEAHVRRASVLRRYGLNNRSGTDTTIPAVADISATLVKQVTCTTDTSSSSGLRITIGEFVALSHHAFEIRKNGVILCRVPPDGGLVANSVYAIRVYPTVSGDYATLANDVAPYLQLPNAGTGGGSNGPKIWGGLGVPSATTVGTGAIGDYYFRMRSASSTPVLYCCSVAGTPGTWVQVI